MTAPLDLAITGGTVVDGTGAPRRSADVGVRGGRIVEVVPPGRLGDARAVVDATGRLVTPGFVDPHTHMDAQLWWEPSGAPSVLHGVTSVVIGSCGFGIAPLHAGTEEYVLRSLEAVEEIPYDVTRQALPMSWRSWADYFDQLGSLRLGVNVAGFVPHSALRVGTLGDTGREVVGLAQRDQLAAALAEAVAAGAIGFSTSRGGNHTDAHGAPVPSRHAGDDELAALLAVSRGRVWQINIAAKGDTSAEGVTRAKAELDGYRALSEQAGVRLTWTPLVVVPGDDWAWRQLLDYSEANQDWLVPQVSAQSIHSAICFDGPSFAAMIDGWAQPFAGYGNATDEERRSRMADPAFRRALRAAPEDCGRVTAPCYSRWRIVSTTAEDALGRTLLELGQDHGTHPVDALCDLALHDDLTTVVEAPLSNVDEDAVRELVTSPSTLIGLGDAGAHVNSISNYSYPTHVLGEQAHRRGWLSVEEAVRRLSAHPASVMGLEGRGTIRDGAAADLCVIDADRLAVGRTDMVADLPGGGRRLHRGATGFDAVIVNGAVTVRHDALTDDRAGVLLRR